MLKVVSGSAQGFLCLAQQRRKWEFGRSGVIKRGPRCSLGPSVPSCYNAVRVRVDAVGNLPSEEYDALLLAASGIHR